jgi:hypothetical protein
MVGLVNPKNILAKRGEKTVMYTLALSVLTLILVIITLGCGFTIHFGGESFKNAITGHMVLGIITLILALATTISLFISK